MIEICPPQDISNYGCEFDIFKLFLGGSIENGAAKPWQRQIMPKLKKTEGVIFNPRRPDWNSSWKPVASNKKFREQVEWELTGLEICDAALMYFDPATKSPISLLETGLFAHDRLPGGIRSKLHVVCPNGFWRKGNVDIVCGRYEINQYASLSKACEAIKQAASAF